MGVAYLQRMNCVVLSSLWQWSSCIFNLHFFLKFLFPFSCVLCSIKVKSKRKVKYVYLYSALSRSNALPFPVNRRWSPQANPTARHQRILRDHVIRVSVLCDMPVYPLATPGTHSAWAGSGWVGLGAWFRAEVVYPSKDGHPPGH